MLYLEFSVEYIYIDVSIDGLPYLGGLPYIHTQMCLRICVFACVPARCRSCSLSFARVLSRARSLLLTRSRCGVSLPDGPYRSRYLFLTPCCSVCFSRLVVLSLSAAFLICLALFLPAWQCLVLAVW